MGGSANLMPVYTVCNIGARYRVWGEDMAIAH